jgi:hypothetical protein
MAEKKLIDRLAEIDPSIGWVAANNHRRTLNQLLREMINRIEALEEDIKTREKKKWERADPM